MYKVYVQYCGNVIEDLQMTEDYLSYAIHITHIHIYVAYVFMPLILLNWPFIKIDLIRKSLLNGNDLCMEFFYSMIYQIIWFKFSLVEVPVSCFKYIFYRRKCVVIMGDFDSACFSFSSIEKQGQISNVVYYGCM